MWGDSPRDERHAALRDLAAGEVRAVFSVDLFNEGVDVPAVDTVLMLRPTESPTLFLQQLGRGLRRAPGKAFCTVLDFVGTHRREFRFDRRYRALLGGTRRELERTVQQQFPFLPAGCHMQLDQKATEIVLRSLREAIPSRWPSKVEELRSLRQVHPDIDLAGFLDESGLELDDVYDGAKSWSDLQAAAGAPVLPDGPHETELRRAVGRLLHIDDDERIATYQRPPRGDDGTVGRRDARAGATPRPHARRRPRRTRPSPRTPASRRRSTSCGPTRRCAPSCGELLAVLDAQVDHLHAPLATHPDVPLQVHGRYSRIEILAAFGIGTGAKIAAWQSGVYEAKDANAELFAFTLDKSSGSFSPTTRYRDYAISRTLIHWESQSITRADSPTGLRYRNHERDGRSIMLFTRLRADDRAFWFLGPARYIRHEGEKPMAITWELAHPLPGDLYASFAAAVG